jgi:hypothetical protein
MRTTMNKKRKPVLGPSSDPADLPIVEAGANHDEDLQR